MTPDPKYTRRSTRYKSKDFMVSGNGDNFIIITPFNEPKEVYEFIKAGLKNMRHNKK